MNMSLCIILPINLLPLALDNNVPPQDIAMLNHTDNGQDLTCLLTSWHHAISRSTAETADKRLLTLHKHEQTRSSITETPQISAAFPGVSQTTPLLPTHHCRSLGHASNKIYICQAITMNDNMEHP